MPLVMKRVLQGVFLLAAYLFVVSTLQADSVDIKTYTCGGVNGGSDNINLIPVVSVGGSEASSFTGDISFTQYLNRCDVGGSYNQGTLTAHISSGTVTSVTGGAGLNPIYYPYYWNGCSGSWDYHVGETGTTGGHSYSVGSSVVSFSHSSAGECVGSPQNLNHNWSISITIGTAGTYDLTGHFVVQANYCTEAHNITVEIDGVVRGEGATSGNGSPTQQGTVDIHSTDNLEGHTYEWFVDGVSQGSGTIHYDLVGENTYSATIGGLDNIVCGEPTPTPTPDPSPNPTASPLPSATPAPTPPQSGTPPQDPGGTPPPDSNGGPATTKYPDVYSDVRQALNDSGNQDSPMPNVTNDFDYGNEPNYKDGTDLENSVNNTIAIHENVSDSAIGKIASAQAMSLPTGLGDKATWDVTLPVLGSFTVDVTPYDSIISLFRALCLMMLLISTWFVTIRIIRSGIA